MHWLLLTSRYSLSTVEDLVSIANSLYTLSIVGHIAYFVQLSTMLSKHMLYIR